MKLSYDIYEIITNCFIKYYLYYKKNLEIIQSTKKLVTNLLGLILTYNDILNTVSLSLVNKKEKL